MNERPTGPVPGAADQELPPADHPRAAYGYAIGLLAALGMAVLYAIAAEVLGLTFGLLAVGFFGGWAIGGAVSYGAWSGRAHVRIPALQRGAAVIAGFGWFVGLLLAYIVSRALLPESTIPLLDRIHVSGFVGYLSDVFGFVQVVHLVALVAAASMAWRGAQ